MRRLYPGGPGVEHAPLQHRDPPRGGRQEEPRPPGLPDAPAQSARLWRYLTQRAAPAGPEGYTEPVAQHWPTTVPRIAALLLTLVVLGGTIGYMVIEGWSAWDAFYMTIISVTTVGYREVQPMSRAGEAFTIVLLVGGVGTMLYSFTLIGARVIEGTLQQRWERRRIARMLDRLQDHFIVCGYGRIGSIVVDEFQRQRVPS